MNRRIIVLVLILCAAAALVAAATGSWPWSQGPDSTVTSGLENRSDEKDRSADQGGQLQVKEAPKLKKTSAGAGTEPKSSSVQISKVRVPGGTHFALPDGSWAPCLNGVTDAPAMSWPPEIKWSPIKRKIIGRSGQEWYEHEDGSYSITRMLFRSDLGKEEAVTQVMNPQKAAPRDTLPGTGLGPRASKLPGGAQKN